MRSALDGNGLVVSALAYYDNNLAPGPGRARGVPRPPPRVHRRRGRARRRPVGTFIGRDPGRSVAENLREAERVFPPLVDYAGERGVR